MLASNLTVLSANKGDQSDAIGRNNFDFCRFWLAVMVIFSHSFAIAEGDEENEPLAVISRGQTGSGQFAVCCFFAISGFLITHSLLRSSSGNFLRKRILRIYPGFIVAVLIGAFFIAPIGSGQFGLQLRELLLLPVNLIALRRTGPLGEFPNNPLPGVINGSLWTIPYEFKCYLGLMLMSCFGLLTTHKYVTILLLLGVVIGGTIYPFLEVPGLERGAIAAIVGSASLWFRVLPFFLAGTTFYLFRHRISFSTQYVGLALIAVAMAASFPPTGRIVFPFAITYLLFWFSFHPSIHFQNWARHGDFSYGTYLYAYPIQQLITMQLPGISPIMLFVISTPLSIMAGLTSWHMIEKKFLSLKHRLPVLQSRDKNGNPLPTQKFASKISE